MSLSIVTTTTRAGLLHSLTHTKGVTRGKQKRAYRTPYITKKSKEPCAFYYIINGRSSANEMEEFVLQY